MVKAWQVLHVVGLATLATGAGLWSLCWRNGYDQQRCCVRRDPSCWDAFFTEDRCCPGQAQAGQDAARKGGTSGGRGDPRCWLDGYTYENCCVSEPKAGCWDSEFGPERCCTEPSHMGKMPLLVTEEGHLDAFVRRTANAADNPLGCEDSPPGLWRAVKLASVTLNVSRQYGMPGERPDGDTMTMVVRHVMSWVRDDEALAVARSCLPGALNAIDLVIVHIDKEVGEAEAKEVYRLHEALLLELTTWPPLGDWPLLAGGFEYVPRLLGLGKRHACHGTALRIYVYRLNKFSHMTRPVLTCAQKMSQCTATVHLHRWLESGNCVTEDPMDADLFYLPAYEACYNETACGFGPDTERCYPPDFDPAVDLPHFPRHHGADHFFVFGCNLLPFADPLMSRARQSIFVTTESYQATNFAGPNMLAWLSHWKDVLVPGYVPAWRISAMLTFNRPMIQRPLLVAFHGHSSSSENVGYMYKRSPLAEVRDRIIAYFWNASHSSVGPPVQDYFRRMGMSRFCLVPAGLTAWTIHLYEAFFFGCVPVILSDEVSVPFEAEIDWLSLSLQVPTTIDMSELHAKLAGFSLGRLKAMYRELKKARCWFDYSLGWGADSRSLDACSPYLGIVRALEKRARQARKLYSLRPFWEPPPRGS